ncbi:hypothetical protein Tco_0009787 [Tanacetum coccineum]
MTFCARVKSMKSESDVDDLFDASVVEDKRKTDKTLDYLSLKYSVEQIPNSKSSSIDVLLSQLLDELLLTLNFVLHSEYEGITTFEPCGCSLSTLLGKKANNFLVGIHLRPTD